MKTFINEYMKSLAFVECCICYFQMAHCMWQLQQISIRGFFSARLDSVLAVCEHIAGNVSARFDPQLTVLLAGLWPELTKGWG